MPRGAQEAHRNLPEMVSDETDSSTVSTVSEAEQASTLLHRHVARGRKNRCNGSAYLDLEAIEQDCEEGSVDEFDLEDDFIDDSELHRNIQRSKKPRPSRRSPAQTSPPLRKRRLRRKILAASSSEGNDTPPPPPRNLTVPKATAEASEVTVEEDLKLAVTQNTPKVRHENGLLQYLFAPKGKQAEPKGKPAETAAVGRRGSKRSRHSKQKPRDKVRSTPDHSHVKTILAWLVQWQPDKLAILLEGNAKTWSHFLTNTRWLHVLVGLHDSLIKHGPPILAGRFDDVKLSRLELGALGERARNSGVIEDWFAKRYLREASQLDGGKLGHQLTELQGEHQRSIESRTKILMNEWLHTLRKLSSTKLAELALITVPVLIFTEPAENTVVCAHVLDIMAQPKTRKRAVLLTLFQLRIEYDQGNETLLDIGQDFFCNGPDSKRHMPGTLWLGFTSFLAAVDLVAEPEAKQTSTTLFGPLHTLPTRARKLVWMYAEFIMDPAEPTRHTTQMSTCSADTPTFNRARTHHDLRNYFTPAGSMS
jgi:hypothetical protein